ncbi:RNI-like protein [Neocallimastix sp. 'constans']
MLINYIFITLYLIASTLAKNDCEEIKSILRNENFKPNQYIEECVNNDSGEVITLKFKDTITIDFISKLPIYKSIKKFKYIEYRDFNYNSKTFNSTYFTKLSNLEELEFKFSGKTEQGRMSHTENGNIGKNVLKLSDNIKKLTLVSIDLEEENIDEISKLSNLEKLDLKNSEIRVMAPNKYLECLKNLNNLTELAIKHSGIKVFDFIYSLKNLKKLYLNNPKMEDDDIHNLSKLTDLEELTLYDVYCSEDLNYDELKSLTNLKSLALHDIYTISEYFTEIPNFVFYLTNLRELNVTCATLKSIPSQIFSLKNLESLNISDAEIDSVSIDLTNFKNLKYLTLRENKLHEISKEITNITNLKSLDLLGNQIEKIPNEISKLKNLEYLDLSNNKIEEIPNVISDLKSLKYLKIKYNQIDVLNKKLFELVNLKELNLKTNMIITIPNEIGNLKNLEVLDLSQNRIYCELPESLNNLSHLKFIDLTINKNIKGKTLINDSLEICSYTYGTPYSICITKDMECFSDYDDKVVLKACQGNISSERDDCDEVFDYILNNYKKSREAIFECSVDEEKKLKLLELDGKSIDYDNVMELLDYKTIKELTIRSMDIDDTIIEKIGNLKYLETLTFHNSKIVATDIEPLSKNKISSLTIYNEIYDKIITVPKFSESFTNLKRLSLIGLNFDQINLNEISSIPNLEYLYIESCKSDNLNFDVLENLRKLITLTYIGGYKMKEIPNSIFTLSNLKELIIEYQDIVEIPNDISKLTNLEVLNLAGNELNCKLDVISELRNLKKLDLSNNNLNTELPESFNNLTQLEFINITSNEKFTGKILDIPSLEICNYIRSLREESYDLCFEPNNKSKCLIDKSQIKPCSNNSELPVSPDGICGQGIARCPEGECCSKYGYCGRSNDHCSLEKGCQSELGNCSSNSNDDLPISPDGICGQGIARCPEGECCSKYGYCGRSNDHCSLERGCQSELGQCLITNTVTTIAPSKTTPSKYPTSTNGKCGGRDGVCPSGECCSMYGYCGRSDRHCSIEKGCQSEFGQCNAKSVNVLTTVYITKTTIITTQTTISGYPTSSDGKCGENYGRCPSGNCCSKFGYCGTGSDYCGTGCQTNFGICY